MTTPENKDNNNENNRPQQPQRGQPTPQGPGTNHIIINARKEHEPHFRQINGTTHPGFSIAELRQRHSQGNPDEIVMLNPHTGQPQTISLKEWKHEDPTKIFLYITFRFIPDKP